MIRKEIAEELFREHSKVIGSQGIEGFQGIAGSGESSSPGLGSGDDTGEGPTCARPFEASRGDLFTCTFNRAAADQITLLTKTGVVHAFLIVIVIAANRPLMADMKVCGDRQRW